MDKKNVTKIKINEDIISELDEKIFSKLILKMDSIGPRTEPSIERIIPYSLEEREYVSMMAKPRCEIDESGNRIAFVDYEVGEELRFILEGEMAEYDRLYEIAQLNFEKYYRSVNLHLKEIDEGSGIFKVYGIDERISCYSSLLEENVINRIKAAIGNKGYLIVHGSSKLYAVMEKINLIEAKLGIYLSTNPWDKGDFESYSLKNGKLELIRDES